MKHQEQEVAWEIKVAKALVVLIPLTAVWLLVDPDGLGTLAYLLGGASYIVWQFLDERTE